MVTTLALKEPPKATGESAAPFLKWAGGKQQLLPRFTELFPKDFKRYIEPFVGSGAVFFHIASLYRPRKSILSDINDELIVTYRAVRNSVEKVIKLLEEHKRHHDKDHYLEVRRQRPLQLSQSQRAARLIYLNKTCFNGLYRVNSEGQFNVPMGSYDVPRIFDPEKLRAASRLLRDVKLETWPFERTLQVARAGDFIYLDPPYHPLSSTSSFTSYSKDSFGVEDQERLAEVYRKLHERGCLLMLSNSATSFIRRLYDHPDIRIETVMARRAINSKSSGRGAIEELVIRNYD